MTDSSKNNMAVLKTTYKSVFDAGVDAAMKAIVEIGQKHGGNKLPKAELQRSVDEKFAELWKSIERLA